MGRARINQNGASPGLEKLSPRESKFCPNADCRVKWVIKVLARVDKMDVFQLYKQSKRPIHCLFDSFSANLSCILWKVRILVMHFTQPPNLSYCDYLVVRQPLEIPIIDWRLGKALWVLISSLRGSEFWLANEFWVRAKSRLGTIPNS